MPRRNGKIKRPEGKIADNPSIANLKKDIDILTPIAKAISFIGRFVFKNSDIVRAAREALLQDTVILDLPDRFNEHFLDEGWIAYNSIS